MFTWKAVRLGLTGAFGLIALVLFTYSLQGGVPISHATNDAHQPGNYKITLRCGDSNVEVNIGLFKNKANIAVTAGDWSETNPPGIELSCLKGDVATKNVTITTENDSNWSDFRIFYHCPKGVGPLLARVMDKVVLGQLYILPDCPPNPTPPPPTVSPTPIPAAKSPSITIKLADVGGIAELPEVAGTPLEAADSSGTNTSLIASVVAAIAAGTVTFGGAAWYARRRFTRS